MFMDVITFAKWRFTAIFHVPSDSPRVNKTQASERIRLYMELEAKRFFQEIARYERRRPQEASVSVFDGSTEVQNRSTRGREPALFCRVVAFLSPKDGFSGDDVRKETRFRPAPGYSRYQNRFEMIAFRGRRPFSKLTSARIHGTRGAIRPRIATKQLRFATILGTFTREVPFLSLPAP